MSRLFTFGCSFTQFNWPTWADIVAYELNLPYQNWGMRGLGNIGIHSRLLECDLRNKFNENDIILVVWSDWSREDRYNVKTSSGTNKWSATGGVIDSYDKNFIDNYCSISNDIMKNSTAIISANKMFDIRFNGYIDPPLINLHNDKALKFDETEKELSLFYEEHIPNDGGFTRTKHPCSYALINELHPDIISHLDYVTEYICPKLDMSLSNKTIDFFTGMHYHLVDFTNNVVHQNPKKPALHLIVKFISMYGWDDILKTKGF